MPWAEQNWYSNRNWKKKKKDEGCYADQEALDDQMTLLPLHWIVCGGGRAIWLCWINPTSGRDATAQGKETLFKRGRLETCASLCVPQKAGGDLKDLLAKGSAATSSWLLHPPGPCAAVEIVSQIQKTSVLWCAEQPWLPLWGHHPPLVQVLCETCQLSTLEIRFASSIFANLLAHHWLSNFLAAPSWLLSSHKPINLRWRTTEIWGSDCRFISDFGGNHFLLP